MFPPKPAPAPLQIKHPITPWSIIRQYLRLCTNHKDYHYAILSGLSVSSLLCPSTFLNSLLLNILSACTFPVSETKFCTHIKQHTVFSILILLFTGSKWRPENSKLNGGKHSVISSAINFFMNVIFIWILFHIPWIRQGHIFSELLLN